MNESEIDNPLKYMCNDGYKNYTDSSLNDSGCTWDVKVDNTCEEHGQLLLATITINSYKIYAYRGNEGEVIYLTDSNNKGKIITRPNKDKIEEFFDSLDNFEKILMNRDTDYTAIFEVMEENSFGYRTEMKTFKFPKTFGGYNLSVGDAAYNMYVSSLQKYASFYDEIFCDNLWRSMTHESIKNFDWTFTREYGVGEEEEYVYGGTRIQKTLRLFGREFDEIKTYIDALKNYQKVDYGKNNSLPDYFLTDALSTEGWDVENIYPFNDKLKQISKLNGITPYHESYVIDGYTNGYFYRCESCNNSKPSIIKADGSKSEIYDNCLKTIRPLIKQYINKKEYSLLDVNNHFMKMLKLNSKAIFRKKGTIQAIESLLGVFGLKSKRWVDAYDKTSRQYDRKYEADYEIKEYITATNYIEDHWDGTVNMNKYDWYNSTKTIPYDTADYRNGIYYSYQGLPVRSYIKEGDKYYQTSRLPVDENKEPINIEGRNRYLFPYFSPYKIIDGNPYYQMNGGWLNRKPKAFTVRNEVVDSDNNGIKVSLFKETYRNIRYVDKLKDLLNLPKTLLRKNDLCYVRDLSNQTYVIIDGVVYDIFEDEKGKYIKTNIINNVCVVGSKMFASELSVSDNTTSNKLMKYVFSQYKENTEIRIYIVDGMIKVFGKYYSANNIMFFKDGNFLNKFTDTADANITTNLFKLNNVDYKTEVGNGRGWEQLQDIDPIYKRVETVVDKFKGNNPHTGHMTYDGGQEYISYFTQLFKYALNGNQFNERCYDGDFFEELETIKDYGFEDLDNPNYEYCYPEYEDTKIHYLGNSFTSGGTRKSYNNELLKNEHPTVPIGSLTTEVSDHIMNIKRIDINFFNKNEDFIVKFVDNIIMSYLEQILPSTLIINVNYCI